MKLFCSFLGVAGTIAVVASGCAQPRISKDRAVQAANLAAETAGYRLAEYKEPKAEFLRPSGLDHRVWWVSYTPRVGLWATNQSGNRWMTNRLGIVVDGTTGAAQIAVMGEPDRN